MAKFQIIWQEAYNLCEETVTAAAEHQCTANAAVIDNETTVDEEVNNLEK